MMVGYVSKWLVQKSGKGKRAIRIVFRKLCREKNLANASEHHLMKPRQSAVKAAGEQTAVRLRNIGILKKPPQVDFILKIC